MLTTLRSADASKRKRLTCQTIVLAALIGLMAGCAGHPAPVSSGAASSSGVARSSAAGSSAAAAASLGGRSSATAASRPAAPAAGSKTGGKTETQPSTQTTNPGDGGSTVASTQASFQPLGNGVMPIGAWIAPPHSGIYQNNPDFITVENYQTAKNSGINILYGLYEKGEINRQPVLTSLNCAAAVGLKYLVTDSNVLAGSEDKDEMDRVLAQYKSSPAFIGCLMVDEPAIPEMAVYGDCAVNYAKSLPNSIYYMNLMPIYAKANQLKVSKLNETGGAVSQELYQQYLDTYVNTVQPRFLSYDYYPCSGTFPSVESQYFLNLSMVRATTRKANIPFWVFIQTCSFGGGTRVPTKAEVLWQVNTALAYGSQGIQYFTYWLPLEYGMVDRSGNPTAIYGYVRTANDQIQGVQNVLMNSRSEGVIINGDSPAPVPSGDVLAGYQKLRSVSGVPTITGCFNYGGKATYYVVNNSLTQSGTAQLHFSETVGAAVVQGGAQSRKSGADLSLTLAPGEGALVTVD